MTKLRNALLGGCMVLISALSLAEESDPYLWLEEVTGEKALAWVKEQNAASQPILEQAEGYQAVKDMTLKVLNSKDKIPYASRHGVYLYNFWRDAKHVRGLYRRTTLEDYRKDAPQWETVLDLDALAKKEDENWVFKGAYYLEPDNDRCLINLSRGGADATVVREFDLTKKAFVEDGFQLPEAKSNVTWRDRNSVFVGTDFGPNSLTQSGYPRIVKIWHRGTPLSEAKTIFEADATHVYAYAGRMQREGIHYDYLIDAISFYKKHLYILTGEGKTKLDLPVDAEWQGFIKGQFIVELKSDWTIGDKTYKQGSLIAQNAKKMIQGEKAYSVLFSPEPHLALSSVQLTQNTILLNLLDNISGKLVILSKDGDQWKSSTLKTEPNGLISVFDVHDDSDDFFYIYTSFLTPSSLFRYNAATSKSEKLKASPAYFNSENLVAEQWFATSKDGTKVPYFIVHAKDWKLDGTNPTLLYGYGGFEVSMKPGYSATKGFAWLSKGGVYVLSNIRGGGEFGPKWHQSALLKNKHKSYEDFIAIAEDLIARKVTSKQKLGIMGGSNGGLLVGAVSMMRPDLFKAVICQVPLLDMKRYDKLLAGASWVAEYGDPDDPEMWDYLKTYSPYHNLKKETTYPRILFATSTRDDRVHPGHARKMVARMKEYGHPVLYFENMEGGHAGAANNEQRAHMIALEYAYLYLELMN